MCLELPICDVSFAVLCCEDLGSLAVFLGFLVTIYLLDSYCIIVEVEK